MSPTFLSVVVFLAAVGCGLAGGLFFIFSNTVMGALSRLRPSEAVAAMNSINRVIVNPLFLLVFLGTGLVCVFLLIYFVFGAGESGRAMTVVGSATYVVGSVLVTMFFNVPLNNALARVDAGDPGAADAWDRYLVPWVRWNHVRTIASITATVCLVLAYGDVN